MAVEKRGVGVEVLGVPDVMSHERTVDKLLIHFLRPRNGGGEVRRVIYPTHVTGQALVIYDEPDDALRVLQKCRHELEFGDRKFPVEVKPVDRPELDLPVEATLNISMIGDRVALSQLIHTHGLEIISSRGDKVRVKGSMMMLRLFKAQTQKLLEAQTSKLTRPPSSSSSLGQSLSPPGTESRNSPHGSSAQDQQNHQNHRRSKDSRSFDSPSPTPSSSRSSRSSRSSFSSSAISPVDSWHSPPMNPPTESFVLSSDVLDYAQRYKKFGMEDILAHHAVEMDVVAMDTDVSGVLVKGWNAPEATAKLQRFLSDLETTLRVRQIRLSDLDHEAQVGIAKRIQELKHNYQFVIIKQMGEAVHLIGPRSSCDELKERVMQQRPAESQLPEFGRRTGRSQEKALIQKRRSQSAPRNARRDELAGEATAKLAPLSSLDGSHSWQRTRDEGGQGATLTSEVRGQRGRANSVTRTSAKPEKMTNHVSPERTNTKPATTPHMKASLMSPFFPKNLKNDKKKNDKK